MASSENEARLGGRLTLLDRTDLSAAQKTLCDRTEASMVRWADEVGFQSKTSDGRFIGPFNPTLRSPEMALSLLQLQLDEGKHTCLSERVRHRTTQKPYNGACHDQRSANQADGRRRVW
jgi:4-carboxymuconolactone decarboxylase